MIITEKYAKKLIREGKAIIEGIMHHDQVAYAILTRHDIRRTDHFKLDQEKYEKLRKKWGEK